MLTKDILHPQPSRNSFNPWSCRYAWFCSISIVGNQARLDDCCAFSHCLFLAPPTFESIMEDMDVHIGETSRLVVVVDGKPIPDIMWYKVGIIDAC